MVCWTSNARRAVLTLLRVGLGLVFLYAAWLKLREPWALFAMAVDGYGVLPAWAVTVVARTLPWFEALLGALLIIGKWLRPAAAAASLLLAGFFVLMVRSHIAGMQIECGCFGPEGDPISRYTLIRDGVLLAASLLLTRLAVTR